MPVEDRLPVVSVVSRYAVRHRQLRMSALFGALAAAFLLPPAALATTGWGSRMPVGPANGGGIRAFSCPSASFCAAVSASLGTGPSSALTFNGASWSTAPLTDADYVGSVSCPSSSFCMAVGGSRSAPADAVWTYIGGAWSGPVKPAGEIYDFGSVSCASSSFCVAVTQLTGDILTFDGSSWSAPRNVGPNGLESVSCPSTSFCAAVDESGNALTFNGSSWSSLADIAGSDDLQSVSCSSASFCAAVDFDAGNALIFNGSSWSAPVHIDGERDLHSVSCPSSSFCVAVDFLGRSLIFNGSSWSAPANTGSAENLLSVSCASSSFCMTGGGRSASMYRADWPAPSVRFTKWRVVSLQAHRQRKQDVPPGAAYRHCTTATVRRLLAQFSVTGPVTGTRVQQIWSLNGKVRSRFTAPDLSSAGSSFGIQSSAGLRDGLWSLQVTEEGAVIGSSSVRLASRRC